MTDRELLELAAKAAGYTLKWGEAYIVGDDKIDCTDMSYVVSGQPDEADWYWSPLEDDGDALRLAVKLGISVSFSHSTRLDAAYPTIVEVGAFAGWCPTFTEVNANDWAAATRRAIVRAAAEIGRGMK
jgi:hypothetical protein